MTCAEARQWISPYLDAELDRDRVLEIGDHLERCPQCRRRFELEVRAEQVITRQLQRFSPFLNWDAIRTRPAPRTASWVRPFLRVGLAAACLGLVIIAWNGLVGEASPPAVQWAANELYELSPACTPFEITPACRPELEPVTGEVMNCRVQLPGDSSACMVVDVLKRTCRKTGKCRVEARLNYGSKPVLLTIARQDCLGELRGLGRVFEGSRTNVVRYTCTHRDIEYHVVARKVGDKILVAVSPADVEPLVASIQVYER